VTIALRPTPETAAEADARFGGIVDPVEQALAVLRWAGETFGANFAITSSMADGLLAHLASRVIPGVNVVFLDTGYHFAETIGTRDWITSVLPITLVNVTPPQTVGEQDLSFGPKLHDRDPDLCCEMRKVKPLAQALSGYVAWGSGIRRDESPTRAGTKLVDWDAKRGMVKVNPMAAWTQDGQPAVRAGLRLHRLRALHPSGRTRRGPPRRPLGGQQQDRVRHPQLMKDLVPPHDTLRAPRDPGTRP